MRKEWVGKGESGFDGGFLGSKQVPVFWWGGFSGNGIVVLEME